MQLVVVLGPPGAGGGLVLFGEKLPVIPGRQDAHDLHRIIRVEVMDGRHMIGDHHSRMTRRATLLVRAVDDISRHAQHYRA
jgi:hypothetical protein